MRSLAHLIQLKKSQRRAARRAAQREQAWLLFEQFTLCFCLVVLCAICYHAGAFAQRQPVAKEKIQMEVWVGQKMTELQTREKALQRRERRAI